MDVLEAIRTRRTTGAFTPDPVPREVVEELLEAPTWAPTYPLNAPRSLFLPSRA